MPNRGFVFENPEDEESDNPLTAMKARVRREMVEKLAAEWNQIHERMERRSFRCRDDYDEEEEYHSEMAEEKAYEAYDAAIEAGKTEEEAQQEKDKASEAYYASVRLKESEDSLKLSVTEELLGELGARMMRPYEHWNEEEKLMEYLETRYDNDDY